MRFRNQTVGNERALDTPRHVFCMSHFVRVTPSMTVSFKSSSYKSSIDEHAEKVVEHGVKSTGRIRNVQQWKWFRQKIQNTNIQHEEDGMALN